ncbi:MAG: hypothetical protein ACREPX_04870 [Rhodanobacteraceae bacterium]
MKIVATWLLMVSTVLMTSACGQHVSSPAVAASPGNGLTGAWRSHIRFASGAFAGADDLEFMLVFNAGGTMTESSNYDGAPPVPPAYGIWRENGPRQFEARYSFYMTKPPTNFDEVAKGGGWLPAGHGMLTEKITLSEDGKSFKSTIVYASFDAAGNPAEGGGEGTGEGVRMGF